MSTHCAVKPLHVVRERPTLSGTLSRQPATREADGERPIPPVGPRQHARDSTLVIHQALRHEILTGELIPGSWISQVQMARRFGLSRGPIREALRLLEREGLVESAVNKRARVSDFSVSDLEQLYAARIVNEGLAVAATVQRFSTAEIGSLEDQLDEMERHAGGDLDVWERLHRSFHSQLVQHAGERITRMLSELSDHAARYRRIYITADPRAWSVGAAEHREIVAACLSRDAALAAALLGRHLARTALTDFAFLAPEHEPALVRAAMAQLSAALPEC